MRRFVRVSLLVSTLLLVVSCGESTGPGDEPAVRVSGSGNGTGTIILNPGNVACTVPASKSCTSTFDIGATVTVTAVADPGSSFTGWSGAGCAGSTDCVIQVDQKTIYKVSAGFTEGHVLAIVPVGTGSGQIISNPGGIDCTIVDGVTSGAGCIRVFPVNTQVTLSVAPLPGTRLLHWGGDGIACPGRGICTVRMEEAMTVESGLYVPFYASHLATGHDHTCALADSIAYCWGYNGLGQLGNGNTGGIVYYPRPVASIRRFVAISSQIFHTCALTADGETYCWGDNAFGQLGTGDTTIRNIPTKVEGAPAFTKIAVGRGTSCGLIADGHAYCWGRNSIGELGNGNYGDPVLTPTLAASGMVFSSISPGEIHVCGISSGSGYCWGNNYLGELGNGTSNNTSQVPVLVSGGPFTRIDAGFFGTCGLSGAHLYCWGGGFNYSFGNNSTTSFSVPTLAANGAFLLDFSFMSYHGCGIGVGLNPLCWGDNTNGAIGDGSTVNAPLPTAVRGEIAVSVISSNRHHTCALTDDQITYCWGLNYWGQLGTGDSNDRYVPAPVIP